MEEEEEELLIPGINDSNQQEIKTFVNDEDNKKLYGNIKWHESTNTVYERAVEMLENAFNPLRLMSSELYLYQDVSTSIVQGVYITNVKLIEGPLLEMELWLKPREMLNAIKKIETTMIDKQNKLSMEGKRARESLRRLRPVISMKQIDDAVTLPNKQGKQESTKKQKANATGKQRRDYDVSERTKQIREIANITGYAISYKTLTVYLKEIYKNYINTTLIKYLRWDDVQELLKLVISLVNKVAFFKVKYHRFIQGGGDLAKKNGKFSGGWFRVGYPSDLISWGPTMLINGERDPVRLKSSPKDLLTDICLKVYILEDNQWKKQSLPDTDYKSPLPDKEQTIEDIIGGKNALPLVDQLQQENIPELNDFDVLGEFFEDVPKKTDDEDWENPPTELGSICLKCLKSCE